MSFKLLRSKKLKETDKCIKNQTLRYIPENLNAHFAGSYLFYLMTVVVCGMKHSQVSKNFHLRPQGE